MQVAGRARRRLRASTSTAGDAARTRRREPTLAPDPGLGREALHDRRRAAAPGPDARMDTRSLAAGELDPDGVAATATSTSSAAATRRSAPTPRPRRLARSSRAAASSASTGARRRRRVAASTRCAAARGPAALRPRHRRRARRLDRRPRLSRGGSPAARRCRGARALRALQGARASRVRGASGRAARRRGRAPAATLASPPMPQLIALRRTSPSDNFYAETLLKVLGRPARRRRGTHRAPAPQVVRAPAGAARRAPDARRRLGPLAREPHHAPRSRAPARRDARPRGRAAVRRLAGVAGRTGTLRRPHARHRGRGRCRAKTGTLNGVSALAGYCDARAAPSLRVLMNGVWRSSARTPSQDRMGGDRAALDRVSDARRRRSEQRQQAGLVEHRDAEALGLLELRARATRRRRRSRSSSTPTRSRARRRR